MMTPEEIEISNKKYEKQRKQNKNKIRNFLETATPEQWEEIVKALLSYHEEYGVDYFEDLDLDLNY